MEFLEEKLYKENISLQEQNQLLQMKVKEKDLMLYQLVIDYIHLRDICNNEDITHFPGYQHNVALNAYTILPNIISSLEQELPNIQKIYQFSETFFSNVDKKEL